MCMLIMGSFGFYYLVPNPFLGYSSYSSTMSAFSVEPIQRGAQKFYCGNWRIDWPMDIVHGRVEERGLLCNTTIPVQCG